MSRAHFYIKLSPAEARALGRFLHKTLEQRNLRARHRGQAIYWSNYGWTVTKIAQQLKVSERSIWKWLKTYQQKGLKGLKGERVFRRLKTVVD